MTPLWLPPGVTQEMHAERQQHIAEMFAHAEVKGKIDYWNRELKAIDRQLELIKASESATHPELKPGYWHILRVNADAPPLIKVHQAPSGGYREPDTGMLRELQEGDMWRSDYEHERQRKIRAAKRASERDDDERREELYERVNQALKTSIRIPRAI